MCFLVLLFVLAAPAQAHVVRFDVISRTPIGFGYEKIVGRLTYADKPGTAANARIVDLAHGPRDAYGEVESSGDVVILAPVDHTRANGAAVIDIPNRGFPTSLWLDRGRFSGDASHPDDLGDGFLMRHGFVSISLGWEWDVPHQPGMLALDTPVATDGGRTITGLVRSDFHVDQPAPDHAVAHYPDQTPYPLADPNDAANVLTQRDDVVAPRMTIPRARWHLSADGTKIALDGGFVPGKIYELVYRAKDPVIVGLGLAAVRDAVAYFERDPSAPVHVARAYGFGISQSGRFLRTFVQRGFDTTEDGHPVFDGMMPIVSGPSLGSFDFRFAQPSRDAAAFSTFFYPTDIPPFREADFPLPAGLKVIDVDTSHEYWGRTASLLTTSNDGRTDVPLPSNVRLYAIAGGMHVPGLEPTLRPGMRQRTDPLDWRWVPRAMLLALDTWVRNGTTPPPSVYPTIASGTLVRPGSWIFPAIPGLAAPNPFVSLHRTFRYDYGPRWSEGIIDREPPGVGAAYATLVPKPDADGIDLGMLRLPEIAAPLATYTGWNLRDPRDGFGDHLVDFFGSFVPFAPTRAARDAANDPRASIAERYGDEAGYLRAYEAATKTLIADGYVLPEDAKALHARALALWPQVAGP
jgi:hypothetical protein